MTGLCNEIWDAAEVRSAIERVARAIVADTRTVGDGEFALVGLYQQGVGLARRISAEIERISPLRPELGTLDISMYRDDVGLRSALPLIRETDIPFVMENARVILVDDVLSTGRTIRAALEALTDYGRPALIRLAVLIDRENAEYPIRADYVGGAYSEDAERKLIVEFAETEGRDRVYSAEWRHHFTGRNA